MQEIKCSVSSAEINKTYCSHEKLVGVLLWQVVFKLLKSDYNIFILSCFMQHIYFIYLLDKIES